MREPTKVSVDYADAIECKFNNHPTRPVDWTYSAMPGQRFDRIVYDHGDQRSVHCFIERETGKVYKPSGWTGPAKVARYDSTSEALKFADPFGSYLYSDFTGHPDPPEIVRGIAKSVLPSVEKSELLDSRGKVIKVGKFVKYLDETEAGQVTSVRRVRNGHVSVTAKYGRTEYTFRGSECRVVPTPKQFRKKK